MEETEFNTGRNRGKQQEDDQLFATELQRCKLNEALKDMNYLVNRDYSMKTSLELVGNRYRLVRRQMNALQGMTCSDLDVELRTQKKLQALELKDQLVYIDGFNLLIILESYFSGGFIFKGKDGCYRDIASVHGSYKRVNQTEKVLIEVGRCFAELGLSKVIWVFDRPISNSGQLKTLAHHIADLHQFNWEILLEFAPDKFLTQANYTIVSSDAWVLQNCYRWFNLVSYLIEKHTLTEADFDRKSVLVFDAK